MSVRSMPSGSPASPRSASSRWMRAASASGTPVSRGIAPRIEVTPGLPARLGQPRRVQLVVLGGRAEVPQHRVALAREQHAARALVARPLADVRARDVADVVLVEQQHRAQVGLAQRRTRLLEPVAPQPGEVDPLLPVDRHRGAARGDGHVQLLPRSFRLEQITSAPASFSNRLRSPAGVGEDYTPPRAPRASDFSIARDRDSARVRLGVASDMLDGFRAALVNAPTVPMIADTQPGKAREESADRR